MKYTRILGIAAVAAAFLFPFSRANAWTAGALIKGRGAGVFYVTSEGKRLAFPDEQTYMSWYPDWGGVEQVSESYLNSMPLAGYVTYRPGTKMVKIDGVATTYAVSRGKMLRWVKSEAVARAIFGDDWNKKVVTLPSSQFQNYRIGEDITSGSQFSVQAEKTAAADINADLRTALVIRGFTP